MYPPAGLKILRHEYTKFFRGLRQMQAGTHT